MPFESEAQRRFLWMKHPQVAEKWAHEYPNQGTLPRYKNAQEKVTAAIIAKKRHG